MHMDYREGITAGEWFAETSARHAVEAMRFSDGTAAQCVGPTGGIRPYNLTSIKADERPDVLAIRYAYGRDVYGRDILSESNYAVLTETYPGAFVVISYQNVDQLAILADTVLPDDLADTLDALGDFPVVDESDYSDREYQYVEECWEGYGRADFRREIARALDDDIDVDEVWPDDKLDHLVDEARFDGLVYSYLEYDGSTVWEGLVDLAVKAARDYRFPPEPESQPE